MIALGDYVTNRVNGIKGRVIYKYPNYRRVPETLISSKVPWLEQYVATPERMTPPEKIRDLVNGPWISVLTEKEGSALWPLDEVDVDGSASWARTDHYWKFFFRD